jgi:aldose 1-epimerase
VLGLVAEGDADWPFPFAARQYFTTDAGVLLGAAAADQHGRGRAAGRPGLSSLLSSSGRAAACTSRPQPVWETDATKLPTRKVAQSGIDADLAHLDYDHCFEGWRGRARIRDERFSLQLVSELPWLVVYTPAQRDYFCVEPVSHLSNAIHMAEPAAHGLVALAPGQTLEAAMRPRCRRRSRPGSPPGLAAIAEHQGELETGGFNHV